VYGGSVAAITKQAEAPHEARFSMDILFVFFALGPAAFFYSLAYLLKRPSEWQGPAILLPIGVLVTVVTQKTGLKWQRRRGGRIDRTVVIASQVGGIVMGVVVGLLTYFVLLE